MTYKNKQALKRFTYLCVSLSSIVFSSESQAEENSSEDIENKPAIDRRCYVNARSKHSNYREKRLELFGLDKFDNSFEVGVSVLEQIRERNIIWKKNLFQKLVKDEYIKYDFHQEKIINYINYYIKEILDVKSATDLKHKEESFFDFQKLISVAYTSLSKVKQQEMDEELSKVNLEEYALSPILFRYLALHEDRASTYPSCIEEKIRPLLKNEKDNRLDRYKYHQSLSSIYKENQIWLKELSNREEIPTEKLNSLISLISL